MPLTTLTEHLVVVCGCPNLPFEVAYQALCLTILVQFWKKEKWRNSRFSGTAVKGNERASLTLGRTGNAPDRAEIEVGGKNHVRFVGEVLPYNVWCTS